MRILYVEDSERLQKSVSTALRRSGFSVDVTGDGEEGLWFARSHPYDVVILDIMLPGLDGISVLKKIRDEGNNTQVLLLTAKDTVDEKIEGFDSGADDYLVKPFALRELLARVNALCRRKYGSKTIEISVGDLVLNTSSKTASRAGQPLDLTAREYSILEYLMMRKGVVVSRADIESHVYDDMVSLMSNAVDSAIYLLRKKLAVAVDSPSLIHTRRGQGYIMEELPE